MLEDTHAVLVTGELVQVLYAIIEELVQEFNGENLDDLLNKVGRVAVYAKVVEILSDLIKHQRKLLVGSEDGQEVLESMRPLFVGEDVGE